MAYVDFECCNNRNKEKIPVDHVISKLDSYLAQNDYPNAKRILVYWENDGRQCGDYRGLLSILSEEMGLSRKMNEKEFGLKACEEAIAIIEKHDLQDLVSIATILLNAATTYKAFGRVIDSIPIYEAVKENYKKNLKKDDSLWAGFYNNYALALVDIEDYDLATFYYKEAIDNSKNHNDYLHIAVTYVNMADLVYKKDKDENEIARLLLEAYKLFQNEKNQDGYYAYVISNASHAYRFYGYEEIAENLERRANFIYEGNRNKGSIF